MNGIDIPSIALDVAKLILTISTAAFGIDALYGDTKNASGVLTAVGRRARWGIVISAGLAIGVVVLETARDRRKEVAERRAQVEFQAKQTQILAAGDSALRRLSESARAQSLLLDRQDAAVHEIMGQRLGIARPQVFAEVEYSFSDSEIGSFATKVRAFAVSRMEELRGLRRDGATVRNSIYGFADTAGRFEVHLFPSSPGGSTQMVDLFRVIYPGQYPSIRIQNSDGRETEEGLRPGKHPVARIYGENLVSPDTSLMRIRGIQFDNLASARKYGPIPMPGSVDLAKPDWRVLIGQSNRAASLRECPNLVWNLEFWSRELEEDAYQASRPRNFLLVNYVDRTVSQELGSTTVSEQGRSHAIASVLDLPGRTLLVETGYRGAGKMSMARLSIWLDERNGKILGERKAPRPIGDLGRGQSFAYTFGWGDIGLTQAESKRLRAGSQRELTASQGCER
jgi:hypothetical protein